MRKYEIMVILKPLLPDDIRRSTMEKVEKTVKEFKGEVKKSEVWGKRHLAYEVGGHSDGYYVLWGVELDPKKVDALNKELSLVSDVLRHIVLQVEQFDLKEIK